MIQPNLYLAASFVLVVALSMVGRWFKTPPDHYISSTLTGVPYPSLSAITLAVMVAFGWGILSTCPEHPRSFHACALGVTLLLGFTLIITLPMSRKIHYACAFSGFLGILLLLGWDAHIRQVPAACKGALGILSLLLVLNIACWYAQTPVGPWMQGALVLGIWLYMTIVFTR